MCSSGGGGCATNAITRLVANDGSIKLNSAIGVGPVVDISVVDAGDAAIDTRAVELIPPGKRSSELFPLTDEETLALSDLMPPLGTMSTQEDYNAWILKALGILATNPSIMSIDGGDALLTLPNNISPVG